MSIPVWPTLLPVAGSAGVSGGPQSNVISFQPRTGPTIDRRAATSINRVRDVELPMLTQEQYQVFKDFFHNTLADGVLPFTWVDPMTSEVAKVKILQKSGEVAYRETRKTRDYLSVQFQIMVLR